jgi:iron complex outermembrane receptor protein
MPAGSLRAAAGASYRAEHLDNSTLGAANPIEGSLMRHVCSVFAEALVPIVGEGEKSGHTILEISVAARHDRYSDFGSVTNPKYGIAWYPTADLLIRGTFGKSFQPPTLFGLAPQPAYVTFNIPDPNSVSGFTDTLFDLSQGNAGLRAQNSRSYTAGFELRPHRIPQLKLSATFFHTRYNNLIGAIPVPAGGLFGVLQYQSLFAPFITRSPRLSEVQSYFARTGFIDLTGLGPAAVGAIVDGRLQNLATATQSGLDLQGSYTIVTSHGDIGISLAGTHFTRFNYQPSPALPTLDVVNHVGEPLAWKANGGVHWTFAGLHSDLIVNYANAYLNDYFTPATHVASWTTLDLNFGYDFGASNVFALLKGTSVAFTIQNALDRSPPAVPIPAAFGLQSLGYDPANASPLGRVLSLRVQVKW